MSIFEREINILRRNINISEQAKLANNLDITGIPKTNNENLKLVVSTLAKIVNIEVKKKNLKKIFQLRNKDDNNSRIEFNNNEVK